MKLPSMNKISLVEMIVFAVFVLYLIFPVTTPAVLIPYINTNISIGLIIILCIYMLFYMTPVLGVLSIFVAYELLRRSSTGIVRGKVPMVLHTPSQPKKDAEMKNMNPAPEVTLEEKVIQEMAPVGKMSKIEEYVETSFKPIQEKIEGASMV